MSDNSAYSEKKDYHKNRDKLNYILIDLRIHKEFYKEVTNNANNPNFNRSQINIEIKSGYLPKAIIPRQEDILDEKVLIKL